MPRIASNLLLPAALVALLSACANPQPSNPPFPESMPAPPPVAEEHLWLRQLVGEWEITAQSFTAPDSPMPEMQTVFREKVSTLGDYWIVSHMDAEFDGVPFRAQLTLGWDPAQGAFVGSWVDTFSTYQWVYRGELDAARRVLTLNATGPSFTAPGATAEFRDVLEFDGPDLRHNSSWTREPGGEWIVFMRSTATRRD